MAFEILPHTDDIRIRATGTTLEALFLSAARGLMSVLTPDYEQRKPDATRRRTFAVHSLDRETLLIEFLSKLLATIDTENEVYPQLTITELHERGLRAEALGTPVEKFNVDIKAVTYQDMAITETPEGYETTITLDV